MSCRLILVEGIPGSGKTTTASWLHERLSARGIVAEWHDELDRSHPVIDRTIRSHCREPDYAQRCVDRWSDFARRVLADETRSVHILEACLFQGTIRFLLEHDHAAGECERYVDGTRTALAALQPEIVYLLQADARGFYERDFEDRRGREWAGRIVDYTETTACSRRHGWRGREGMIDFYMHYRGTCLRLLPGLQMPTLQVDTSDPDGSGSRARIGAWLDDLVASGKIRAA